MKIAIAGTGYVGLSNRVPLVVMLNNKISPINDNKDTYKNADYIIRYTHDS